MSAVIALANAIMFTTYALYYIQALGLNPFQLVLVGSFLEIVVFVFEIPTGVLADTYSRRLSVIIAFFIMGVAYIIEGQAMWISHGLLNGAVSLFALVVISEMIRGVGETFLSGAEQSWVTDELGEERIGKVFLRASQVQQAASVAGIVASVLLSSVSLNLPYVTGGALYIALAIYLAAAMRETNYRPVPQADRDSWGQMKATFNEGISFAKRSPVFILVLIVSLSAGASSEGFDRLWEAHLLTDIGLPRFGGWNDAVWFGAFSIVSMLLGLLTNEAVIRKANLDNHAIARNMMFVLAALKIMGLILFALAPNLAWALVGFCFLGMLNSVFNPLYAAWLNQQLESRTRSTLLSFLSQANAIGQTAGGPLVGWAGVRYTIRVSIVLSACLLLPLVMVFRKLRKRQEGG